MDNSLTLWYPDIENAYLELMMSPYVIFFNIIRIKQIIQMQRLADTSTVMRIALPYDCTTANVLVDFQEEYEVLHQQHTHISYDCVPFKRRCAI